MLRIHGSGSAFASAFCVVLLLVGGSALSAESFLNFGFGVQSNLADVGNTITKDGVDSLIGTPTKIGANWGTGCETAADRTTCLREQPGAVQRIVIPERLLRDYENNSAGAIRSRTTKTMLGADLLIGYEMTQSWWFLRVDVSYTRRVYGGRSSSEVAGIPWYRAYWDFHRTNIPVFFGIKAGVGETVSFYVAPGLSYLDGAATIKINNIGDIPTTLLGGASTTFGTVTVIDAQGRRAGGAILREHAIFRARGPALNFLLGAEAKLSSGNRFFVELHQLVGGDHATTAADDLGTAAHLSRLATLPINLSGTIYRVGLKWAM